MIPYAHYISGMAKVLPRYQLLYNVPMFPAGSLTLSTSGRQLRSPLVPSGPREALLGCPWAMASSTTW